jgi:glucose/arabinose dehydrogenase
MMRPANLTLLVVLLAPCFACGASGTGAERQGGGEAEAQEGTTQLELPDGFSATVFAEGVGRARHLDVRDNGDVYVRLREGQPGIVALRDTDGDGRADVTKRFGDHNGTGLEIDGAKLYVASDTSVLRYRLPEEGLVPTEPPTAVVRDLPQQNQHAAKSIALGAEGRLYVNVGAPSNACQEQTRTPGSPGERPCPELERHGGLWVFDTGKTGQSQAQGERFATGIRHAVALAWDPASEAPYIVMHGRDQLHSLWPEHYSEEDNAELPAEEFHRIERGADYGWPYTYWDPRREARVVAPEYGGNGEKRAEADAYPEPLLAFPAHWAPNDLLFYTGDQFPERYHGGAFIAFHGSWNRAPLPQQGYRVAFVPFSGGRPADEWETFANGFAGTERIRSPREADHRPMGLAQGPDGALYIADSVKGRIWRVTHGG